MIPGARGVLPGVFALCACVSASGAPKIGDASEAKDMALVGFHDLQARSAYQPVVREQNGRVRISQEIEECRLALNNRRDRLAVADFEIVGDVGIPLAGRTITEEILPHFRRMSFAACATICAPFATPIARKFFPIARKFF